MLPIMLLSITAMVMMGMYSYKRYILASKVGDIMCDLRYTTYDLQNPIYNLSLEDKTITVDLLNKPVDIDVRYSLGIMASKVSAKANSSFVVLGREIPIRVIQEASLVDVDSKIREIDFIEEVVEESGLKEVLTGVWQDHIEVLFSKGKPVSRR